MTSGGRSGGLARRAPRGAASPRALRVLLAVVASAVVTAAVAGPMGYQAYEARHGGTAGRPASEGPTTTPPPRVLATTNERDPAIRWTTTWNAGRGEALDASTVTGRIIVFVDQPRAVDVRFWLDPAGESARWARTDRQEPLTLVAGRTDAQPGAYDTATVPDGRHIVVAEATLPGGVTERHVAVFTVDNR